MWKFKSNHRIVLCCDVFWYADVRDKSDAVLATVGRLFGVSSHSNYWLLVMVCFEAMWQMLLWGMQGVMFPSRSQIGYKQHHIVYVSLFWSPPPIIPEFNQAWLTGTPWECILRLHFPKEEAISPPNPLFLISVSHKRAPATAPIDVRYS